MKEFEFRLQSLLNLKEQEEKKIQKELAHLKKEERLIKEKVESYRVKKDNYQLQLMKDESEKINLSNAMNCRNYINYLTEEITDLENKLAYWSKKIAKCRNRLLEKTKEKKMLTKLKEKKEEEHWYEFTQQENKENDEIAINSFNFDNGSLKLSNDYE